MKKRGLIFVLVVLLIVCSYGNVFGEEKNVYQEEGVYLTGASSGIYINPSGIMYVTDLYNKYIWKVEGDIAKQFAGRTGTAGISGEPIGGYNDAGFADSAFMSPWGISPFMGGFSVSDSDNNVIRQVSPDDEEVYTAVGSGKAGYKNGIGLSAEFNYPTGLATDANGDLYIADTGNHVIRKLDQKGRVTTFAGSAEGCQDGDLQSAAFREPTGLYYADGTLYVADSGNHRICKIQNGAVTTLAGSAIAANESEAASGGFANGKASEAKFSNPQGVAVFDGKVYVADTGNGAVRVIEGGMVRTLLKSSDRKLYPVSPRALYVFENQLYVGDVFANLVFKIPLIPSFHDISQSAWYFEALQYVCANDLFTGVSKTKFSPSAGMTRGMFVTVLSRMYTNLSPSAVIAGEKHFADVKAPQYYGAPVSWAADMQITDGTGSGMFSPNDEITREQMTVMLYNLAKISEKKTQNASQLLDGFSDLNKLSPWAADAMQWAVSAGIINGNDMQQLMPQKKATRAEAAQVILNYARWVQEQ